MRLLPIVFIAASTGAAAAGGAYDISGSTVGTSESNLIPVSQTQIYMNLNSNYTLADTGTPLSGNVGNCTGFMDITVGKGASGQGVCVWADADGDQWFGPWSIHGMGADGATAGTWYVSGGTGKFAGATGGGSFSSKTDRETGASTLDVSGSVALK